MVKTVLYDSHLKANANMVDFAGFMMPLIYSSISEEHMYVREKAGMFDVSHMGEFYVKGKEAEKFVDHIFTNDVLSQNDNQVLYGMMCYPSGGVVDDLLVYKINRESFIMIVNASNIDKDFEWATKNNTFDCTLTNESNNISEVALQGPLAEKILNPLTDYDLTTLPFFTFQYMKINGKDVLVSRTGYTGEDGFEIYGDHDVIVKVWDEILEAGQDDVMPTGLGCRDTLRFEVALPLYGNELSKDITPLEAGLSFAVKLEAGDFIGKDVLVKQKLEKTKRRIVGLKMLDKGILRHGYKIYHDETLVGEITTGYKSPSTGETVAMAMIDRPYDKLKTELLVDIRGKKKKVVVRNKKFYQKSYKN
ncbi:MAG: glycine cleavage system aminomethyltransferase GcvT [Candidatus Izimaplasma sp.]|nr:glycine cleavage system aminomethyltransferase GcvT [Candidatus Izimaplasma bacterium]